MDITLKNISNFQINFTMSFNELCQTVPGALLEYCKIRYSDPTLASSQKSILITLQFVEGLHNNLTEFLSSVLKQ